MAKKKTPATKLDAAQDPKRVSALKQMAKRRGMPFFQISAVSGEGLPELIRAIAIELFTEPEPITEYPPTPVEPPKPESVPGE